MLGKRASGFGLEFFGGFSLPPLLRFSGKQKTRRGGRKSVGGIPPTRRDQRQWMSKALRSRSERLFGRTTHSHSYTD